MPAKGSIVSLVGRRFERLTVLRLSEQRGSDRKPQWVCACDCGRIITVRGNCLTTGNSKSCGCWKIEASKRNATTHGLSKSVPEYKIWIGMRRRCLSPKNQDFPHYGGRGISICERWQSFENFYTDMGSRPTPKHSIDRVDNDGPYSPENCRWATQDIQTLNRRPDANAHLLTHGGITMTLAQWVRRTGISRSAIKSRLRNDWPIGRTLTEPVKPG